MLAAHAVTLCRVPGLSISRPLQRGEAIHPQGHVILGSQVRLVIGSLPLPPSLSFITW